MYQLTLQDNGTGLVLFTPQLLLVLIVPTHGGMPGWVDLGGWLHARWFTRQQNHRSTNRAQIQSNFVEQDQHITIKPHWYLIITVIKEYGLTDRLINKMITQKTEFKYKTVLVLNTD